MLSSPFYTAFLNDWKIGGWGKKTLWSASWVWIFLQVFFVCVFLFFLFSSLLSLSFSPFLSLPFYLSDSPLHLVHWTDKLTFCFHCEKDHTKIFRQHFFVKFKFLLLETILRYCAIICGKSGQDKIFCLCTLNNKINFDTD